MSKNNDACEECCGTGILSATLVKDEHYNNIGIKVKLHDHFDKNTEANVAALEATGLTLEYVKQEPVEQSIKD